MKNGKIFAVAALAAAVVLVTAGCTGAAGSIAAAQSGSAQAQQSTTPVRTITVNGMGTATGAPDLAQVSIGVNTSDASLQKAVADNAARMTQLLAALKAQGIADKDIRTVNYSVSTETPPQPKPVAGTESTAPVVTYRVSNQVQVTVRDVAQLGDVLDKGVNAGANSVYGISFSVADPSALEATARSNAVADAKARAESLAKLAGVTLGDVYSISESGAGPQPLMRAATFAAAASTPIQTGSFEVSASVQIVYLIK